MENKSNVSLLNQIQEFPFQRIGPEAQFLLPIMCVVVFLVGLGGNGLVIFSILSNKEMQSSSNILILNMALVDALVVTFVPALTVTYIIPLYPFGNIWCKFNQYFIYACSFVGIYTLVAVSINRYLAVVYPVRSIYYRTKKNSFICALVIWIISLIGNIPTTMYFEVYNYAVENETKSTCDTVDHKPDNPKDVKSFYGSFFVLGYFLPVSFLCILYGRMLKKLRHIEVPGDNQSNERMRVHKRVTKLVVTVVFVYAFCNLPLNVVFMIQHFGYYPKNNLTFAIQNAAYNLGLINSCVNPFIYAFLSTEFREKFARVLCCKGVT